MNITCNISSGGLNKTIELENIPINDKILDKRKNDIKKVIGSYMLEFDTAETRTKIRRDILKILQKDIRLEKLKKIEKALK